jgi:hypothetical protein
MDGIRRKIKWKRRRRQERREREEYGNSVQK